MNEEVIITEKSGDFTGSKFDIKDEDIPLVLRALQEGIYSNPIGSIVREIISNALDSHTETGRSQNVEVEISKSNRLTGAFTAFIVRDFGTGISPDRMNNIFCNYFKSTKRGSNDSIGGFGIGAKSPLSYTDMFYISTVVEGKKYNYVIHKDQEGDRVDLIGEAQITANPNSTEVVIPIKKKTEYSDLKSIGSEIKKQLSYIENITYIGFDDMPLAKYERVYEDENVIMTEDNIEDHLIIGNIIYPLNHDLTYEDNDISSHGIGFKFNIGDLDISINREEVRYTQKTIKVIKEKITASCNKLYLDISDKVNTESDAFLKICKLYALKSNNSVIGRQADACKSYIKAVYSFKDEAMLKISKDIDSLTYYELQGFIKKNTYSVSSRYSNSRLVLSALANDPTEVHIVFGNRSWTSTLKAIILANGVFTKSDTVYFLEIDDKDNKYKDVVNILISSPYAKHTSAYDYLSKDDFPHLFPEKASKTKRDDKEIFVRFVRVNKDYASPIISYYNGSLNESKLKEKTFVYGFQENDSLLKLAACINASCSNSNYSKLSKFPEISIIKIAKNVEKKFKQCDYIEDWVKSKDPILIHWNTARKIKPIIEEVIYLQSFARINADIAVAYKHLNSYCNFAIDTLININLVPDYDSLTALLDANETVNKNILAKAAGLSEYGKGIEILKHVEALTAGRTGYDDLPIAEVKHILLLNNKPFDNDNKTEN